MRYGHKSKGPFQCSNDIEEIKEKRGLMEITAITEIAAKKTTRLCHDPQEPAPTLPMGREMGWSLQPARRLWVLLILNEALVLILLRELIMCCVGFV